MAHRRPSRASSSPLSPRRARAAASLVVCSALAAVPACVTPDPDTGGAEAALVNPPPVRDCSNQYGRPLWVLSSNDNSRSGVDTETTTVITWVSDGRAEQPHYVAVRIAIPLPSAARYAGAGHFTMPIIIDTPLFMGDDTWLNYGNSMTVTEADRIGAIAINFLKPGMIQTELTPTGETRSVCSDGAPDGGAEDSRRFLAAVAAFATGARADRWGNYIVDATLAPRASTSNVGVYASSHAGMLALRTFAEYGLDGVSYVVGWENPLADVYLTGELGRLGERSTLGVFYDDENPFAYADALGVPRSYDATDYDDVFINPDHPFVLGGAGLPMICDAPSAPSACYQTDGTGGIFLGGGPTSVMSVGLTLRTCQALCPHATCTSAFNAGGCPAWPAGMVALDQVNQWQRRAMIGATIGPLGVLTPFDYFPAIGARRDRLHAMLLFHEYDHKSGNPGKPKTQQAYRGLHDRAGAWVRLNPDEAYQRWAFTNRANLLIAGHYAFPDNRANAEPGAMSPADGWTADDVHDWSMIVPAPAAFWFHGLPDTDPVGRFKAYTKLAGLAEMMDRTQADVWRPDLADVLYDTPAP